MTKNVNVMMDVELKKALDKDAKKNHRSVGKHINFIIDSYLNEDWVKNSFAKKVAEHIDKTGVAK